MKKSYQKPEFKKVNFSYEQVVVASGYCDQGWTKETVLIPWGNDGCAKCYQDFIWIGSTDPNS